MNFDVLESWFEFKKVKQCLELLFEILITIRFD